MFRTFCNSIASYFLNRDIEKRLRGIERGKYNHGAEADQEVILEGEIEELHKRKQRSYIHPNTQRLRLRLRDCEKHTLSVD